MSGASADPGGQHATGLQSPVTGHPALNENVTSANAGSTLAGAVGTQQQRVGGKITRLVDGYPQRGGHPGHRADPGHTAVGDALAAEDRDLVGRDRQRRRVAQKGQQQFGLLGRVRDLEIIDAVERRMRQDLHPAVLRGAEIYHQAAPPTTNRAVCCACVNITV
jgi:hypothetical protein